MDTSMRIPYASPEPKIATSPPSRQIKVSNEWYRLASTPAVSLTATQANIVRETAARAHANLPNLYHRAQKVSWGGPDNKGSPETNWWYPMDNTTAYPSSSVSLETLDGGHLLYGYLHIMKWDPNPHFPFRLCGEKGCPPERAIAHSLEWREKYKPWCMSPSGIQENVKGFVYTRGYSPSLKGDKKGHD